MASLLQTFLNTYAPTDKGVSPVTPLKGTPVEVFSQKWNQDTSNLHPPSDESVHNGLLSSFGLGLNNIKDKTLGFIGDNINNSFNSLSTLYGGGSQGIANKLKTDVQQGATDMEKGIAKGGTSGTGDVLKGIAKSGFRTAGDVAGTIYAPVSALLNVTGANKLFDYVGELSQKGGKYNPINALTDLKSVQDFVINHPNIGEDFVRALNIGLAAMDSSKIDPSTIVERTKVQFGGKPSPNTINVGGEELTLDDIHNKLRSADIFKLPEADQAKLRAFDNAESMKAMYKTALEKGDTEGIAEIKATMDAANIPILSNISPSSTDIISTIAKPVIETGNFLKNKVTGIASDVFQSGKNKIQDVATNTIETRLRDTANKYVVSSRKLNQMESNNGTKPIETISSYGNEALPVIENGKINPNEAQDFLSEQISELSQIKNDAVFLNDNTVSLPDFHKYTFDMIDAQKNWTEMKKTAVKAEANKIFDEMKISYTSDLSMTELDKIKTEQTGLSSTYKNPKAKFDYDTYGIIGKSARGIVEMFTEDAPTKELNKLIQSHYDAIDFYESLRGKAPSGGLLSKNIERAAGGVVGAIAGSSAGHPIVGAIAGRGSVDLIMSIMNNHFISNPLKRMLIKNMDNIPSDVKQKALNYIDQNSPDIGNIGDQSSSIPNIQSNSPNITPNASNISEPTNLNNDVIPPDTTIPPVESQSHNNSNQGASIQDSISQNDVHKQLSSIGSDVSKNASIINAIQPGMGDKLKELKKESAHFVDTVSKIAFANAKMTKDYIDGGIKKVAQTFASFLKPNIALAQVTPAPEKDFGNQPLESINLLVGNGQPQTFQRFDPKLAEETEKVAGRDKWGNFNSPVNRVDRASSPLPLSTSKPVGRPDASYLGFPAYLPQNNPDPSTYWTYDPSLHDKKPDANGSLAGHLLALDNVIYYSKPLWDKNAPYPWEFIQPNFNFDAGQYKQSEQSKEFVHQMEEIYKNNKQLLKDFHDGKITAQKADDLSNIKIDPSFFGFNSDISDSADKARRQQELQAENKKYIETNQPKGTNYDNSKLDLSNPTQRKTESSQEINKYQTDAERQQNMMIYGTPTPPPKDTKGQGGSALESIIPFLKGNAKESAEKNKPVPGEFTMYNPVKGQTDNTPRLMASGKDIYDGAIATSDRSIPFGTQVYVPELKKTFTVEDRMNKRYDPKTYGKTVFDIPTLKGGKGDIQTAKDFGRKNLHFIVVGHDGRKKVAKK